MHHTFKDVDVDIIDASLENHAQWAIMLDSNAFIQFLSHYFSNYIVRCANYTTVGDELKTCKSTGKLE